MSYNPYSSHSSHSSRRNTPSSRSPSSSPLPSNQRHPPPSSGHYDYLSPSYAHYPTPRSNTNSAPFPLIFPHMAPPPPPFTSVYPSPHLTAPRPSFPQGGYSISPTSPPIPPTSNPYPHTRMLQSTHPPPGSRPLAGSWPSVGIHNPVDTIYRDYSIQQQSFQLSQGQTSIFEGRRAQGMFHVHHSIPVSPRQPSPMGEHSHFFGDGTGRLDVPVLRTEHLELAQGPAPHYQPISDVSLHPAANSVATHRGPAQWYTHHFDASGYQNYHSTHLGPSFTPQLSQGQGPPQTQMHQGSGMFTGSHHFSLSGDNTFIDKLSVLSDNFMREFLQHTIIGAEFDSSARDPPPRCRPGTRLAIIQRCLDFIGDCTGREKLRWVVGPAGIGKSAVMQMVVEKAPEGVTFASVFLSINGRRDGMKVIMTIAYQLAVKGGLYHRFIRDEIGLDPSLLRKSLSIQFDKFIVEPFIHRRLFDPSRRFFIAIDGLDECDNPLTQQKLLELISNFCISYPTSPIAWIVASRPEPHITVFFDRAEVRPAYTKEEMVIDSDEACNDVQVFLRAELKQIQDAHPTLKHKQEWPSEHEFTQIAAAAGGLFAYAATVVRYIGDPYCRNPTARLRHVLEVIDGGGPGDRKSGTSHPMAQLDALYDRILSNIPDDVMVDTRKMLFLCSSKSLLPTITFREQCNLLGLTEDAAYAAICNLHAVMKVPEPPEADQERLMYFHKSFEDFLFDSQRSGGFSHDVRDEVDQLMVEISLKIAEQVPNDSDGENGGKGIECYGRGHLRGGVGSYGDISLSWPRDERFQMTDDELRLQLYRDSVVIICIGFSDSPNFIGNISCFDVLTTRFNTLGVAFPLGRCLESVFRKLRLKLTERGELKQVPLRTLDYAAVCGEIHIRFVSLVGVDDDELEPSDPWNKSCKHGKQELQQESGWSTVFHRFIPHWLDTEDDDLPLRGEIPRYNVVARKESHREVFSAFSDARCDPCSRRFARHWISTTDRSATVFVDNTEMCYVELTFVDPDDGVSEWTYWFCHSGVPTCY